MITIHPDDVVRHEERKFLTPREIQIGAGIQRRTFHAFTPELRDGRYADEAVVLPNPPVDMAGEVMRALWGERLGTEFSGSSTPVEVIHSPHNSAGASKLVIACWFRAFPYAVYGDDEVIEI